MIILDANVLSEPVRASPDERVINWLLTETDTLAVTAVTVGELLVGVRRLPLGHRRSGLEDAVEAILSTHTERVLSYDESAARHYAQLMETRRAVGRPLSVEDGMIAAICLAQGARLATRHIRDFSDLQLELIDPWSGPSG